MISSTISPPLPPAPKFAQSDFKCLVILADGWGQYLQKGDEHLRNGTIVLHALHGVLHLKKLRIDTQAATATAAIGGVIVVHHLTFPTAPLHLYH